MRRLLYYSLGGVAILVALVYGWRFLTRPHTPSPAELAATALTAGTSREREAAVAALSHLGKPAREHLLRVLNETKYAEVRAACVRGLAEQWYYRGMPTLLDAMDDPSVMVRAQAGLAVQRMLRMDYGFRADDPEDKRREAVEQFRAWWEEFKTSRRSLAFIRQQQGEDL